MPAPAYTTARYPRTSPERMPTKNSPPPRAFNHPTVPPYSPRENPSNSRIRPIAAARGDPPTAGVGNNTRNTSNKRRPSGSTARTGV